VYDQFADLVAARVAALKVGDGLAEGTTLGPLISPAGVDKVSGGWWEGAGE
jgi:succinate-semialdehyde dehydrogenase/glutarate-semialdehyde dehydrogenase